MGGHSVLCANELATGTFNQQVAADKILGKPSHIGQLGAAIFDNTDGSAPLDIPKAQFAFKLLQFVPESQRDTPQVRSLLAQAYKFLAWDDEQPATDETELDWFVARTRV